MNDPAQDGEYSVMRIEALFELDVLVPERVSEEVKADAVRSALEESNIDMSVSPARRKRYGEGSNKDGGREHLWC